MKDKKVVVIIIIMVIIFICLVGGIFYIALGSKKDEVSTENNQQNAEEYSNQESEDEEESDEENAVTNEKDDEEESDDEENVEEDNSDTQTDNEKSIVDIDRVKFIAMPLKDNSGEFVKTIKINDESEIKEIVDEINKAEECPNFEEEVGETGIFNNTPILAIEFNDDTKTIVYTMNNFSGGGEQELNIMRTVYTFNEGERQSPIYEIKINLDEFVQRMAQKHAE